MKRAFVIFFVKIIGSLPFSVRSGIGKFFGFLFSFLPTKDRTIAKLQMDFFLKEEGGSSNLRGVYKSVVQNLFESLNLVPFISNHKKYMRCNNWEIVQKYLLKNQGGIFLSAHTANWDLLAAFVIAEGVRLSTVGREARNETFQSILEKVRNGYGIKTIWRSDRSAINEIKNDLKDGRWMAALIDQDTAVTSKFLPFFGFLAKSPSTLVSLAKEISVPIVTIFAVREGFNSYSVKMEEIDPSLEVTEMLQCYNNRLESLIKKYPEQWVWFHKRWRTRPNGERMSSKSYIQYLERLIEGDFESEAGTKDLQTAL